MGLPRESPRRAACTIPASCYETTHQQQHLPVLVRGLSIVSYRNGPERSGVLSLSALCVGLCWFSCKGYH